MVSNLFLRPTVVLGEVVLATEEVNPCLLFAELRLEYSATGAEIDSRADFYPFFLCIPNNLDTSTVTSVYSSRVGASTFVSVDNSFPTTTNFPPAAMLNLAQPERNFPLG